MYLLPEKKILMVIFKQCLKFILIIFALGTILGLLLLILFPVHPYDYDLSDSSPFSLRIQTLFVVTNYLGSIVVNVIILRNLKSYLETNSDQLSGEKTEPNHNSLIWISVYYFFISTAFLLIMLIGQLILLWGLIYPYLSDEKFIIMSWWIVTFDIAHLLSTNFFYMIILVPLDYMLK